MGMYKYIKKAFQQEYKDRSILYRARLVAWRAGATVTRVEKPLNIVRARTLGYKAKEGIIVVRVKTNRGSRKRPHPWGGRKPAKNMAYVNPGKSYQALAEEKAGAKFRNMEVLNSYFIGNDGQFQFYEVLLVDVSKFYGEEVGKHKGRVFRGLTAAGHRHRGLQGKGFGYEKQVIR